MPAAGGAEFENILVGVFRKKGWRVRRRPAAGDMQADLLVDDGEKKYVVELKSASEARRDRLVPLLSQAILQAQAISRRFPEPAAPLAVVAAGRIPASVVDHLKQFAERNAPDVAIGIIDANGFRSFVGPGLEALDAASSRSAPGEILLSRRLPDLFSDANQWMLKILLGQKLPESLMSVPRAPIRNASQLAHAANVSIMSASRLVNHLKSRGFLEESDDHLGLVRIEELLEEWISANRHAAKQIPARWIIKGGPEQLLANLRNYNPPPECCLGLFAAANVLGLGFVHGAPQHIYLERVTLDSLNRLGLLVGESDRPPDVYIRVPVNRKAVFQPVVKRDGIPVADILQVWLDVSAHPVRGRGREQALEITRQVLTPLLRKYQ
jgi:Restriction endonuclease